MRLDRHLNLVIPVEREGVDIYVHSSPISREVFNRYFLPLSKTYAEIYRGGLNVIAGPRVAAMLLRKIAAENNELAGDDGVESGLINEIKRLTNVMVPTPQGWQAVPIQQAVEVHHYLELEEMDEIENVLVFFTLVCAMYPKKDRPILFRGMKSLWGTDDTSLNSTEFARSLAMPTEDKPSTIEAA